MKFFKPLAGQLEGRLISIDALRGMAAIAVMLFHTSYFMTAVYPHEGAWSEKLEWLLLFLNGHGRTGVWLFFVISGFCIHLKWARGHAKGDDTPPAFLEFWKRRLWRLYPAYAAAMVLSIVLFYLSGELLLNRKLAYDVFMHALLIHNLDNKTAYTINAPFWTLAVEEQLYLLYFVLLRMRMKWGWQKTLAICLLCRIAWMAFGFLLTNKFGFTRFFYGLGIGYWFLWALGAVSVEAWYGTLQLPAWTKNLSVAAMFAVSASFAMNIWVMHDPHLSPWIIRGAIYVEEPLWGMAYFVLVNWFLARNEKWSGPGGSARIVRMFALAGVFSYSIYLIHSPIIETKAPWFMALVKDLGHHEVMLRLLLMAPITLLASRVFFELFERRFLRPASR